MSVQFLSDRSGLKLMSIRHSIVSSLVVRTNHFKIKRFETLQKKLYSLLLTVPKGVLCFLLFVPVSSMLSLHYNQV